MPTGCPWCRAGQCGAFLNQYDRSPSGSSKFTVVAFPWVDHPVTLIGEPSEASSFISPEGQLMHFEGRFRLIPQSQQHNHVGESVHHDRDNRHSRSLHTRRVLCSPDSHCSDSDSEENSTRSNFPYDANASSCLHRMSFKWMRKVIHQLDALANFAVQFSDSALNGTDSFYLQPDSVDIHLGPAAPLPPVHSSGERLVLAFL